MSLTIQEVNAQPQKQIVIQSFMNTEYYLGVNRKNGSSAFNNTMLEKADTRTATKWRVVKEQNGNYGLICSKNGGTLQTLATNTDNGTQSYTGSNLATVNQKWTFKLDSKNAKVYFIQSIFNNPKRVIDIHGYELTHENNINAHTQNDGSENNDRNQKWRLLWAQ